MTTFEAVSAHWPRPLRVRSTQNSRRSHRSRKATSAAHPRSPLASFTSSQNGQIPISSPVRPVFPVLDIKPDIIEMEGSQPELPIELESSSDEEEENPFEAFAMTQASQSFEAKVEVNSRVIQRDVINEDEIDVEELEQQRHAEDAKHHAEEGQKFRATQASARYGEDADEYDDEEIDELFRRTVAGGLASGSTTPRRKGLNGSATPSTTASRSGGSVGERRRTRDQRMREQAGLGDLR